MKKSKHIKALYFFLALSGGVLFAWSVFALFELRFSRGDVHEAYSSLRSDPLGCKALHDSFSKISGLNVRRLMRPPGEIKNPSDSVLFVTGARFDERITERGELLDFVLNGGRLLVFFSAEREAPPGAASSEKCSSKKIKKEKNKKKRACGAKLKRAAPAKNKRKAKWGFKLIAAKHLFVIAEQAVPAKSSRTEHGFSAMPFYSAASFEIKNGDWNAHYFHKGKPVMIERHFGKGSAVISTASYFISNEGLRKAPQTKLLSHLIGEKKHIYFDEKSHGLKENRNIIWLGKKYKLGLLALNLLLLAGLFVWKCACSVSGINARGDPEQAKVNSDFTYASGLVNLLKRSVPQKGLAASCEKEWKKTVKYRHIPEDKLQDIEELAHASGSQKDQVNIYNRIHKIISKRKRGRNE